MTNDIEIKTHHLEMIQGIITRMSSNSFLLKGWSVTLMAGMFALNSGRANCYLFAYVLVFLFWMLDSMYLQFERQFKVLYKNIVNGEMHGPAFEILRPPPSWKQHTKFIQAFFSRSEMPFYVALLICNAVFSLKFFA